jgi:hypothetical protein
MTALTEMEVMRLLDERLARMEERFNRVQASIDDVSKEVRAGFLSKDVAAAKEAEVNRRLNKLENRGGVILLYGSLSASVIINLIGIVNYLHLFK